MNNFAKEITREYRLDFNNGETHWDDPISPEVTSRLLGRRVTCVINRTSLLAWTLMMEVREVELADVTADGWMKIEVSTGPDFNHAAFTRDIDAKLTEVTQVGGLLRQDVDPAAGSWPLHEGATRQSTTVARGLVFSKQANTFPGGANRY